MVGICYSAREVLVLAGDSYRGYTHTLSPSVLTTGAFPSGAMRRDGRTECAGCHGKGAR